MSALPLGDGVKLLLNWFAQREHRCAELGYPHDASRYRAYGVIVERLRDEVSGQRVYINNLRAGIGLKPAREDDGLD